MRFLPLILLLLACGSKTPPAAAEHKAPKPKSDSTVTLFDACTGCAGYCNLVMEARVSTCSKETCTCVFPDDSLDTRKWDESAEETAARIKRLAKWPRGYDQLKDPSADPPSPPLTSEEWCRSFHGDESLETCMAKQNGHAEETDDGTLTPEEWCRTFIAEEGDKDYTSCVANLKAPPKASL